MVAQSNGGRAVKAFVHEPEVRTQSRSREHTSDRIFAKLLREGLRQAPETITGRAAATGRSSAANLLQKLCDIRPFSVLQ